MAPLPPFFFPQALLINRICRKGQLFSSCFKWPNRWTKFLGGHYPPLFLACKNFLFVQKGPPSLGPFLVIGPLFFFFFLLLEFGGVGRRFGGTTAKILSETNVPIFFFFLFPERILNPVDSDECHIPLGRKFLGAPPSPVWSLRGPPALKQSSDLFAYISRPFFRSIVASNTPPFSPFRRFFQIDITLFLFL